MSIAILKGGINTPPEGGKHAVPPHLHAVHLHAPI